MDNIKEIKIELTEQCERNCIHCSSDAKKGDFKTLNIDVVKGIVDMAADIGITSVVFTGGEAMLYPDLEHIIEYTKNKGLKVKLYTMCNPDELSILKLSKLNLLGLDEMIYSLSYQLTTDGVVNQNKIKLFINELINRTNLKIGFHYVITNKTIDDTKKMFDLVNNFDSSRVNKLSFLRYVPHGRGDYSLLPTKEQLNEFKSLVTDIYKKDPTLIRLGSPFNILNITHNECTAASDTIIVGFDGSVYPCDAMKYFDYLGTGGNIYKNTLVEIRDSEYFQNIRNFRCHVNEDCLKCNNYSICKSGCLGQKLICNFNDNNINTFEWYEVNAKRTMNKFKTSDDMAFNHKTGIFGESGELFDNLKKYYTHNLTEEKKKELKEIMIGEIGDIIWYVVAPLATSFDFSADDIISHMVNYNKTSKKTIDSNIIKYTAGLKDPLCPYSKNNSFPINIVDQKVNTNNYNIYDEVDDYILLIAKLITCKNKEEVLDLAAKLLLFLGRIANCELNVSLESVIKKNVEKLQKRYPIGFNEEVTNSRISYTKKYKLEEAYKKND